MELSKSAGRKVFLEDMQNYQSLERPFFAKDRKKCIIIQESMI